MGTAIEPLDQADLEILSLKTALLLALMSVKGLGDLGAQPGWIAMLVYIFHGM